MACLEFITMSALDNTLQKKNRNYNECQMKIILI